MWKKGETACVKVREDFITNSSSSSFIISRIGGKKATVNDVYQYIQEAYRDVIKRFTIKTDSLEKKYGDLIYASVDLTDCEWVNECETYADYEDFWIKKIKDETDCECLPHAPFIIYSASDERVRFLYHHSTNYESPQRNKDSILNYYQNKWSANIVVCDDIFVVSECGFINDFVVDELKKCSRYSCDHMC